MVDNQDDHWSNRPWVYVACLAAVFVFFASFKIDWGSVTAAWVQAVGSVAAIFIAILVTWVSHWLDVRRSEEAIRREEARTLETVAAIMINAMNLIETAKKNICDNGSRRLLGYCMEVYDPGAFKSAAEALREIPIAHLPDFTVVKPVLEMRDLVLKADSLIEHIHRSSVSPEGNVDEGIKSFRKLHHQANVQTSTVEEAVRRVRD